MATMTAEKLSPTVGAMVHGVDREQLVEDEALPEWIHDALEENGVLVFRDLHIDDETQIAFSKRLGTIEKPGGKEIFLISLDPEKSRSAQYLKGTFDWHIDGCTDDIPIMATVLSAHAVAESGGETEFASTYGAYDDLTDDEQQRFESVRVVHTIEATQRLVVKDPTPEQVEIWRTRPAKVHPLVWNHLSGRRSLVLGATTDHVEGMEAAESRAFLDGLLDRSTQPDRVYRHEWRVGDMVIWDNRGVLHRACPYPEDSPREMHRVTIAGEEAIQ
jgi:alpha-ketoglutarate-dependent taurine dioxygenase